MQQSVVLLITRLLQLTLLGALTCCTSTRVSPENPTGGPARRTPLEFTFPAHEGLAVSSKTTQGRVTVLAFITMYDLASQVMVRRLEDAIRSFRPRANAAAIVLESPRYSELVPVYAAAMQLPYPIAMANFDTYQGVGPFAGISRVPTLVVLDKRGREVDRHAGEWSLAELLRSLEQATRPSR